MRNAQYLRAQAEFCLEVARQMSDDTIVENLQVEAARYQAEAVKAEHYSDSTTIDPKASGKDVFSQKRDRHPENGFKSSEEKRAYFRLLRHSSVKSFRPLLKKTRRDLYRPEWRIS
jgi:hypothetical protein